MVLEGVFGWLKHDGIMVSNIVNGLKPFSYMENLKVFEYWVFGENLF